MGTVSGLQFFMQSNPLQTTSLATRPLESNTSVKGVSLTTIPSTSYDPSGALFVSTTGSDSNSGTEASPYRTILKAVQVATSGRKIVIRAGTYRETLNTISKQVLLQPYPNEQVWISGSDVVSSWTSIGSGMWRSDGWTAKFCQVAACHVASTIDPSYPNSKYPDMMFIDGAPLTQMDGAGAGPDCSGVTVTSGSFCVDYTTNQLFIGQDPSGKTVEATSRQFAINFGGGASTADGSMIRGLGFKHFGANSTFSGVTGAPSRPSIVNLSPERSNMTFENNVFMYSAGSGLTVQGNNHTIKNNIFARNANIGLHANLANNITVDGNTMSENNFERFLMSGGSAAASGSKITNSLGGSFVNNIIEDNYGNGFWCDLGCKNFTIAKNIIRRNLLRGLFYEVSGAALITSNVVYENASDGISVRSRDVQIYNNTMYKNKQAISVNEDDRSTASLSGSYPCASGETLNVSIKNNILADKAPGSAQNDFNKPPRLMDINGAHPSEVSQPEPADMVPEMDYDIYWRSTSGEPLYDLGWVGKSISQQFTTIDSTTKTATGREANARTNDGQSVSALFTNASAGDFRIKTSSIAYGTGDPTVWPTIASVLGLSSDDTIHIGALVSPEMAYVAQPVIVTPSPTPTPTPAPSPAPTPSPTPSSPDTTTTNDQSSSENTTPVEALPEVTPVIEGNLVSVSEDMCADAEKITYKVGDTVVGEGNCSDTKVDLEAIQLNPGEKIVAEITKTDGTKESYSVFTEPKNDGKLTKKGVAVATLGLSSIFGFAGFALLYKDGSIATSLMNRATALIFRLRVRFGKW